MTNIVAGATKRVTCQLLHKSSNFLFISMVAQQYFIINLKHETPNKAVQNEKTSYGPN